jgi:hypothetical protein
VKFSKEKLEKLVELYIRKKKIVEKGLDQPKKKTPTGENCS